MPTMVTDAEVRAERDTERRDVLVAIQRLLEDRPERLPQGHSRTTVTALSTESGVKRQALYERHRGLVDRFQALLRDPERKTEAERELEDRLVRARAAEAAATEQVKTARADAASWRDEARALARVVDYLETELAQAREMNDVLTRRIERLEAEAPPASHGHLRPVPPLDR